MSNQAEFVAPDITARKNRGLSHAPDYTMPQPSDRYTDEDNRVWKTLFRRQQKILPDRVCREFLEGLEELHIDARHIPEFSVLNKKLAAATGWQLVAVHGLIPDAIFFEHLANRRFPVTWWIREANQLDYLPEPDVFHDLFGHVPLLANPIFANYLQAYGQGGMKAHNLGALPMLARLYWYTVEFGLIKKPQGIRIYGAGIVSSRTESVYCLESNSSNRLMFDLLRIMRTRYRIDTFQKTYFVIESFEQLFEATAPDFTPYYEMLKTMRVLGAGDILASDQVVNRGTQEGWEEEGDI